MKKKKQAQTRMDLVCHFCQRKYDKGFGQIYRFINVRAYLNVKDDLFPSSSPLQLHVANVIYSPFEQVKGEENNSTFLREIVIHRI